MLKQTMGLAIVAGGLCLLGWKQGTPQDAAQQNAIARTCLSNQRQLGLALMMYVQDYDDMLPRKSAPYKAQLMPYVKNDQVFHCPLDAPGALSYTYNSSLYATNIKTVKSPAQTVLIYEGKDMQMDFRHEGKATITFADGHVKQISPDEAKSAFWYAGGKTPAPAARPSGKSVSKNKKKTGN